MYVILVLFFGKLDYPQTGTILDTVPVQRYKILILNQAIPPTSLIYFHLYLKTYSIFNFNLIIIINSFNMKEKKTFFCDIMNNTKVKNINQIKCFKAIKII